MRADSWGWHSLAGRRHRPSIRRQHLCHHGFASLRRNHLVLLENDAAVLFGKAGIAGSFCSTPRQRLVHIWQEDNLFDSDTVARFRLKLVEETRIEVVDWHLLRQTVELGLCDFTRPNFDPNTLPPFPGIFLPRSLLPFSIENPHKGIRLRRSLRTTSNDPDCSRGVVLIIRRRFRFYKIPISLWIVILHKEVKPGFR